MDSPSYRSLLKAKEEGRLTSAQLDVFLAPRPVEELYKLESDPIQINNLINDEEYSAVHAELKSVLLQWMEETYDNVPQELTKDWYSRDTGERIEENFDVRGEMPGEKLDVEHCKR